jgi:hypothetical protein
MNCHKCVRKHKLIDGVLAGQQSKVEQQQVYSHHCDTRNAFIHESIITAHKGDE